MTSYTMKGFAALAGVTVKALRHYERLGLIKPRRTRVGHRRYVQTDLGRLEAITALKYLGFSLDEIRLILNRPASELPRAIAARRQAFDEAEARLTVARDAIAAAEQASGAPLDTLVEAVQTKVAAATMRRYYTEEGWQRRRRYYEEGPADEWRALYAALSDLVGHDPASAKVQAAADRWLALTWRAYAGDPAVQTDSMTAWADRERWPARMQLESASGGDFEIHDALLRMWADREHWSASLRWQVEAIYWMPYQRIQRVADFLAPGAQR